MATKIEAKIANFAEISCMDVVGRGTRTIFFISDSCYQVLCLHTILSSTLPTLCAGLLRSLMSPQDLNKTRNYQQIYPAKQADRKSKFCAALKFVFVVLFSQVDIVWTVKWGEISDRIGKPAWPCRIPNSYFCEKRFL